MHPLEAHQLEVKFFAGGDSPPAPRTFVPVFHQWIQEHRIADELLIDVADYAHVYRGPGVLLVGHEAYYSLDQTDGRLGLAYRRKRALPGDDVSSRLTAAFRATLRACRLLEAEPVSSGLRFRMDEVRLRIQNRLLAPNEEATFAPARAGLAPFLEWLYGGEAGVRISPLPISKEPFGVHIDVREAPSVDALLARLDNGIAPR